MNNKMLQQLQRLLLMVPSAVFAPSSTVLFYRRGKQNGQQTANGETIRADVKSSLSAVRKEAAIVTRLRMGHARLTHGHFFVVSLRRFVVFVEPN
jgi:hypothetical protein